MKANTHAHARTHTHTHARARARARTRTQMYIDGVNVCANLGVEVSKKCVTNQQPKLWPKRIKKKKKKKKKEEEERKSTPLNYL